MTKAKHLARLGTISQLVLDVKLSALQSAAAKRQHSLDQIAGLNAPVGTTDLSPVAAYHAQLRYQHWADARRAELNLVLARQTVDMLVAREEAAQAFGKDQALRSLRARLR